MYMQSMHLSKETHFVTQIIFDETMQEPGWLFTAVMWTTPHSVNVSIDATHRFCYTNRHILTPQHRILFPLQPQANSIPREYPRHPRGGAA